MVIFIVKLHNYIFFKNKYIFYTKKFNLLIHIEIFFVFGKKINMSNEYLNFYS